MKSYSSNIGVEIITDLRSRSDHGFQQLCEEVLQTVFPTVRATAPRKERDRAGIDHCVFVQDGDRLDSVFQCKGFEVLEMEHGQIAQCLHSVAAFKSSTFRAKKYFLVVNRIVRGETRKKLEEAVIDLVHCKIAEKAEVLDLEAFLEMVFNEAEWQVKKMLTESGERYRDQHRERMEEDVYLHEVPYEQDGESLVEYNPLKFLEQRVVSLALQKGNKRSWTFVVGEFGFGKTSLALQMSEVLSRSGMICLYFPVAQFSAQAFEGEMQFMWTALQLIREDEVSRSNRRDRIQHAVFKEMLKRDKRLLLLFDGLDEHPTCYRETGLRSIFGIFKTFNATCIFTMREEFLAERTGHFEAAIKGSPGAFILKLREWNETLVLDYIHRWKKDTPLLDAGQQIQHFEEAIKTGRYIDFYGDIPKRPLFLKMLLVDVLKEDIRQRNLAEIYTTYLLNKFRIDRETSTQKAVVGRPLSSDEDYAVVCAHLFDVMACAAGMMYQIEKGEVQMLPDLSEMLLRECADSVGNGGLNLSSILSNSVLIPIGRRSMNRSGAMLTFTFAHKSFQSFFFAHYVMKILTGHSEDHKVIESNLPPEVIRFVRGLFSIQPAAVRQQARTRLSKFHGDCLILEGLN